MSNSIIQVDQVQKGNGTNLILVNPTIQGSLGSSIGKTVSYVITDTDNYSRIACDTTGGDITITLPLKGNNIGRRIEIANVKGGTNKVIISPNATDANKLSNDGLNVIWLPKIGDYAVFQEDATSGFWEIVSERISSQLRLDTYAGYGSTDTKIVRFTNIIDNYGNCFSENHVSGYTGNAKGLEITTNRSGRYSFSFTGYYSAANLEAGLSLNSNQLTTAFPSITLAHQLIGGLANAGGSSIAVTYTSYFAKNSIVRPHGDGDALSTSYFTATYIGS